jgi:hypothetical protein
VRKGWQAVLGRELPVTDDSEDEEPSLEEATSDDSPKDPQLPLDTPELGIEHPLLSARAMSFSSPTLPSKDDATPIATKFAFSSLFSRPSEEFR